MPNSRQPNILLIILDTTRRDRLSLYQRARAVPTTPELDAFAADAAVFTRAVSPAQWTIPAHASIFTGLYPSAHGLTQAAQALRPTDPTLAEILRAGGYRTAAFCNNPLVGVLYNGLQRGFAEFYNYASAIPQRPPGAESALRHALIRRIQPYTRRIANIFAHNDTLFRLALAPRFTPIWSKAINFKGSTDDSISDAIRWIDAHDSRQPYFAFINLMGAHLPYHPPTDALEHVAPELRGDKAAYAFIRQFNADAAAWASPPEVPFTPEQTFALNAFYDAEILHQDRHLGRLLRYLRESGALDNTVVAISADHGEGHGEHDLFGHGFNLHHELVHVPLIVHDPARFAAGSRPDAHHDASASHDVLASHDANASYSTRRLFHTLLEASGVPVPFESAEVKRLSLTQPDAEPFAFSEAFPPTTFLRVLEHRCPAAVERLRLRSVRRAVIAGERKLITLDEGEGAQVESLYALDSDPFETRNLAAAADAQTEIAALKRQLDAFTAEIGHVHAPAAPANSPEVLERLRALGYIE
jgi:arylsulfatase A-like enzyme